MICETEKEKIGVKYNEVRNGNGEGEATGEGGVRGRKKESRVRKHKYFLKFTWCGVCKEFETKEEEFENGEGRGGTWEEWGREGRDVGGRRGREGREREGKRGTWEGGKEKREKDVHIRAFLHLLFAEHLLKGLSRGNATDELFGRDRRRLLEDGRRRRRSRGGGGRGGVGGRSHR